MATAITDARPTAAADPRGTGEEHRIADGSVNAAGEGMTLAFRSGVPPLPVQRESATCAHGGPTRAQGLPTGVMKEELEGAGRGQWRQQRADQAEDPP